MPEVRVKTICDVDTRLFDEAAAGVDDRQRHRPDAETDFRRLLDDRDIDAIVMGTPTHWHAIPTVLACQAGKQVYVEKPAGHNIAEGRAMLAAARKHNRVVQVGIQSRSGLNYEEACAYVRNGALGKVVFAKAWESARQKGIGYPPDEVAPDGVDYDMWLGPAPKRAFNRNRFHGSWRWFFDYGTGDLGNDGVHRVDYAWRGLAAAFEAMGKTLPGWPTAVSAAGGKFFFDDAQEWPDTLVVTWDYPGATLMYEMRNWQPTPLDGEAEGRRRERRARLCRDRQRQLEGLRREESGVRLGSEHQDRRRCAPQTRHARGDPQRGAGGVRHRVRPCRFRTDPFRQHRLADGSQAALRRRAGDIPGRRRGEPLARARVPPSVDPYRRLDTLRMPG